MLKLFWSCYVTTFVPKLNDAWEQGMPFLVTRIALFERHVLSN